MSITELIQKWITSHLPTEAELSETFRERTESFDAYMESLTIND